MRLISRFMVSLFKEIINDDLLSLANALTYKLLLALFPFLIFLMAVLGFLNIDTSNILASLNETLPPQVFGIINVFVSEVFDGRSISLLSASLFVTVFNASAGFRAIIYGINKSYGSNDKRGPIRVGIISVVLVFLFVITIVISLVALIFGDYIIALIDKYYGVSSFGHSLFAMIRSFGAIAALLTAVCIIYKLSSFKKVSFISVLPGAMVTVVIWILASKAFEFYIANFSRYSVVYGSLASVFIMMIWLNLISFVLLIGSEINALLEVSPDSS